MKIKIIRKITTYIMSLELKELYNFWFSHPKIWFNSTYDDDLLVKYKFEYLLYIDHNIKESFHDQDLVTIIILYDQISRHVFRNYKEKIKEYDLLAYNYCLITLPIIEKFNPEERCFILMPLRHTFEETNLNICLDYVNKWRNISDESIYKRFFEATITALSKILNKKQTLYSNKENIILPDNIYDPLSSKIREIYYFDFKEIKKLNIYNEFIKHVEFNDNQIIISISGGVDSMICSLLLYIYCLEKNIKIIGICINYNNRPEQQLEVYLVSKWLEIFNIEFHVRNITEIHRKRDKDRDFYEKITRNIRFDTYRKFNCPVILGHNKDDSIENIFSNIVKKKNYNNLLGMTHNCVENNTTILRPLLNIPKNEIINFAIEHNIPFVYDSTPSWSERGKLRDVLIPNVNTFNPKIIDGLIDMAHNFYEIYKVYNSFVPNITYENNKCIIKNNEIYFFDYWKNIFQKITRLYNLPMVKNKCIQYFANYIKFGNKITLNKYLIAKKINNDIIIFLLNH